MPRRRLKLVGTGLGIVGESFGYLTPLYASWMEFRTTHVETHYACQCVCGKVVDKPRKYLQKTRREGYRTSCGCRRQEVAEDNARKYPRSAKPAIESVIRAYIAGAKRRGYSFNLSFEECEKLFASACFYCGIAPSNRRQTGRRKFRESELFVYNGVDRRNNSQGYVAENVVPCCFTCNVAKRDMSEDEFFEWACRMTEHYGKVKKQERIQKSGLRIAA